ncbi:fluoride efflux transporter CrcB [Microbacteriaceae bacterium 4G12]
MEYIFVGIAGIAGALLRYALGLIVHETWTHSFPLATWIINMTGSFILAFLTTYIFRMKRMPPYAIAAIGTGFIGSYTTFSTFSVETIQLLQANHVVTAGGYIVGSLVGGLLMSFIGFEVGNRLYQMKESRE